MIDSATAPNWLNFNSDNYPARGGQANVDNFMLLKNHNGQFKGRRPIDLLLEGSIENMRDTYRHIDDLIYGR